MVAAASAHFGDVDLALKAAAGATELRAHNIWFLWLPLFQSVRRAHRDSNAWSRTSASWITGDETAGRGRVARG